MRGGVGRREAAVAVAAAAADTLPVVVLVVAPPLVEAVGDLAAAPASGLTAGAVRATDAAETSSLLPPLDTVTPSSSPPPPPPPATAGSSTTIGTPGTGVAAEGEEHALSASTPTSVEIGTTGGMMGEDVSGTAASPPSGGGGAAPSDSPAVAEGAASVAATTVAPEVDGTDGNSDAARPLLLPSRARACS